MTLSFVKTENQKRYSAQLKCKLIPTRYICDNTLYNLGLKMEIHCLFHSLGMLEFMQCEAPTFERITLEFLSTGEFKLKHRWTGSERQYYSTLTFHLFNNNHELTLEHLGEILHLPITGPNTVADTFVLSDFLTVITGKAGYVAKEVKAYGIHNLCFRYAQKGLTYILFGRGDNSSVATQRELFFLFYMAHHQSVNVAAFAAFLLAV